MSQGVRRRYVMRGGELVEIDPQSRRVLAPEIVRDLQPYRSVRTGEIIDGRAAHREHLRRHDLIEVGNERAGFTPQRVDPAPPGDVAADLRRTLQRDRGETAAVARQALREAGYDGPAIERILRPPR